MVLSWREGQGDCRLLLSVMLLLFWEAGSGQVHYWVSEEAKHGTFVGRITQDLGLELEELALYNTLPISAKFIPKFLPGRETCI